MSYVENDALCNISFVRPFQITHRPLPHTISHLFPCILNLTYFPIFYIRDNRDLYGIMEFPFKINENLH